MSRFDFVAGHRGAFGVKRLCTVLGLSRSGFCRWAHCCAGTSGPPTADSPPVPKAAVARPLYDDFCSR